MWGGRGVGRGHGVSLVGRFGAGLCIGLALFAGPVLATECETPVARAVSIQGNVEVRPAVARQWAKIKLDDVFCQGDSIRVNDNSRASLALSNATLVRIDANSTLTFSAPGNKELSWIDMLSGVAHFISRVKQSFEVVTPFMNAAIEGTEFVVTVEGDATRVSVFEGRVAARNKLGEIILTEGQTAQARKGQAPVLQTLVSPRDAVQWALYYPPILEFDAAEFSNLSPTWQGRLAQSLESYHQGDIAAALGLLEEFPQSLDDPRTYLYRAALRLGVGRVQDAESDLARVSSSAPNNSYAVALQALIAVVQNNKTQALTLAERAVVLDADSATPQLALSYARQANFDIEGALSAVEQAVANDDQDALAWSRLAELHLSLGEVDEALSAAEQAVARNPQLARTQSVLGFARLTQFKTEQARDAFQNAIELDQADPLPRLGLGLATIREGNLAEGREQIEIAASLDPNNALIRSYLGKAYYDEKRDKVAATELANAKQLDPNDPTAWFYDAIRKQTENQPVEALHDLQKSIELNDNRAVYRSSLLLDQDLAARSASLGRIYDDLGFEQLALVEGWKSVNTDPSNYSAHRLLADSYSALPRHEIARVSELLQSQLLQPLNSNPLQPQLAEGNLAILEGAGPSDLSFNEFNPLFTRERIAFQANAIIGSNDTLGNDLVVSGVEEKFSYSLGQFHYETDGFRENNDIEHDIYNAFAQISLSDQSSIQFEARSRETQFGDLEFRFFPENFSPNLRREIDSQQFRVGYHYAPRPRSHLLTSLIYQDVEDRTRDGMSQGPIAFSLDLGGPREGLTGEVQYQYQGVRASYILGAGRLEQDGLLTINFQTFFDGFPLPPPDSETRVSDEDIEHSNLYSYMTIRPTPDVALTLGLSYDDFAGAAREQEQLNPKLGLIWNLTDDTTLRFAALRASKRPLISNQTLEPTNLAGFNQFFDDADASDSRRYGLALDHAFSNKIYAGVEFSWRDIASPLRGLADDELEEQAHRAYLYWTPTAKLSFSAEYLLDTFDRARISNSEVNELFTELIPLQLAYYAENGFSASLGATHIAQDFESTDVLGEDISLIRDRERVWLFDAGLRYRLPRRSGILSLSVRNLLNEEFRFQDRNFQTIELREPMFLPERTVFLRFALSF